MTSEQPNDTTVTVNRVDRDMLIFQMVLREARRRAKKRNPPARFLIDVLDEIGFRLEVAR